MGKALALATQYCTALLAMNKTGNLENEYILIHSASGGVMHGTNTVIKT